MSNLTLRSIGIDTYHENVAYMHRDCETYRAEGFQALTKIEVCTDHRRILAVLNVVDDASIVTPGELGLSLQAFKQLNEEEGCEVNVDHAEPPDSFLAWQRGGKRIGVVSVADS